MPPPLSLLLLLLALTPTLSSSLSTITISHLSNLTIICALFPSLNNQPYNLTCNTFPFKVSTSYPSGPALYSAIAAGDDFLCALASPSSNLSSMIWWDFTQPAHQKRVYLGPRLAAVASSDSHVCAIRDRKIHCWRWPHLSIPRSLNFTMLAVGSDFVCGLLDTHHIKCFGNDTGVVNKEPVANFNVVAAGSRHACGIKQTGGELLCWGTGAPKFNESLMGFVSLALGENRTCARRSNSTVLCWGEDVDLPGDIADAQFMTIEAKGTTFCGILMSNFSLVCWGNKVFQDDHVVFGKVLPAPCSETSSCAVCGVMPGSGNVCVEGTSVCVPCRLQYYDATPPNSPSHSTPPNSSTLILDHPRAKSKRKWVVIGAGSVGLVLALVAVSTLLFIWFGKKKSGRVHDSVRLSAPAMPNIRAPQLPRREEQAEPPMDRRLSAFLSSGPSSTIQEYHLQQLLKATNGFSNDCKIGSGSFGAVYRATLDKRVVAIKRAEPSASTSNADTDKRRDRESAFLSELGLLSRVNHKNLVRLLGFCHEEAESVLVYEFMTNGTLHDHLHKLPSSPLSSWSARLRVALDAARGIEYLHTYAVPPIIHRDIKSSNILLDDSWAAKVSDFGLSLTSPEVGGEDDTSHVSLRAAGTVGYMDPEYYRLQYLTAKSDIYSFGVVLLELLSGCRAIHRHGESGSPRNVVEFAVPLIEADDVHQVLDRRLPPPTPCEIEAVVSVAYIAADCVRPHGRDRPTMREIVGGLERALAASAARRPPLSRSITTRSM